MKARLRPPSPAAMLPAKCMAKCMAKCTAAFMAACMAAGAALPLPARAGEQDRVRQAVTSGAYKPLAGILEAITRQYPGRVVDVEAERGKSGALVYEVKLIGADGRKRELLVDAATGRVLADEQALARQVMGIGALAAHLRELEAQTRLSVTEAEYELARDGQPFYQIKLAANPLGSTERRLRLDARTGAALPSAKVSAAQGAAQPLRSMPEMLQALAAQYQGHVLEVELEAGHSQGPYYEVELHLPSGQTQELRVDARTLAVLHSRIEDD